MDRLFQPKRRAVAIALQRQADWDAQNENKKNMLYNKRVKVGLFYFLCSADWIIYRFFSVLHYMWQVFSLVFFMVIFLYLQTVNRIRDRYHNILAARIQHAYKKHKQRKMEKSQPATKIRRASNLAKVTKSFEHVVVASHYVFYSLVANF